MTVWSRLVLACFSVCVLVVHDWRASWPRQHSLCHIDWWRPRVSGVGVGVGVIFVIVIVFVFVDVPGGMGSRQHRRRLTPAPRLPTQPRHDVWNFGRAVKRSQVEPAAERNVGVVEPVQVAYGVHRADLTPAASGRCWVCFPNSS